MTDPSAKTGWLSRKVFMGATLGAALFFMIVGVIFWGGFNTAMEATNTLGFCISCHEMEDNVYKEYKTTIHFANRSGVRASCSDCHVPDPWVHKVVRKVKASNELFHKALGTVDTPEKFDERRLELAKRVWAAMKSTDSRECRNCHDFSSMDPQFQKPRARQQHMNAMERGQTCIDCHKGIAHSKVHDQLTDPEIEALEKPAPDTARELPEMWVAFLEKEKAAEGGPAVAPAAASAPAPAPAVTPAAPAAPATKPSASTAGPNWAKIPSRKVTVFYPGQTSMEWVQDGRQHGGARPFKMGDRCVLCHDKEAADMGKKLVSGEKAESTPISGKRGSIPVTVQASHDKDYLYMRFQWPDGKHAPVPFAEGGKLDPANRMKLAVMFATDDVEFADRSGCWGTCHHDLRTMPDAPDAAKLKAGPQGLNVSDGVTKYITESRTEIEIRGNDGAPRGGWDKMKDADSLKAETAAGHFMDLLRYKSGDDSATDGSILAERHDTGGQGVEFSGKLEGGNWVMEMKRKLTSNKPGDVSLALDKVYNFGFAIHDDYSSARFHHVSLGYKLGFDNPQAEINAVKK